MCCVTFVYIDPFHSCRFCKKQLKYYTFGRSQEQRFLIGKPWPIQGECYWVIWVLSGDDIEVSIFIKIMSIRGFYFGNKSIFLRYLCYKTTIFYPPVNYGGYEKLLCIGDPQSSPVQQTPSLVVDYHQLLTMMTRIYQEVNS